MMAIEDHAIGFATTAESDALHTLGLGDIRPMMRAVAKVSKESSGEKTEQDS
jgi:hypothetical protein